MAYLTTRGPVKAVDGVSIAIQPGEVVGLAGESGSGKSTIAHAILRILHPPALITGGQVIFDGRDILEMDDAELGQFRWSKISIVFQSAMNALNPVMKIRDQLTDVCGSTACQNRRRTNAPSTFSTWLGSNRSAWMPIRTNYPAGCASVPSSPLPWP